MGGLFPSIIRLDELGPSKPQQSVSKRLSFHGVPIRRASRPGFTFSPAIMKVEHKCPTHLSNPCTSQYCFSSTKHAAPFQEFQHISALVASPLTTEWQQGVDSIGSSSDHLAHAPLPCENRWATQHQERLRILARVERIDSVHGRNSKESECRQTARRLKDRHKRERSLCSRRTTTVRIEHRNNLQQGLFVDRYPRCVSICPSLVGGAGVTNGSSWTNGVIGEVEKARPSRLDWKTV